jgi:hypothetical protein
VDERAEDRDDVPVSVRLGDVVPPEDPEDWTRPLTWVAAGGMLAAPLLGVAWFWLVPPASAVSPAPGTFVLAAAVASGAVLTGLTQRGAARAFTATLGAALFSALALIVVGTAMAGERQLGAASPGLAHAFSAALGGLAGAAAAAPLMGVFAGASARLRLTLAPAAVAIGVAALVVPLAL